MTNELSLDELWDTAPASERVFSAEKLSSLPGSARRYLEHAIAAGAPLATAVRLRMHGEIKLKGWCPFTAEQVIRWDRGMMWRAKVRMHGLSISGGDAFLDGAGTMRWKLFGLIPVVTAAGPDITRSAAGRVNIESIWLPSVLCDAAVSWSEADAAHPHARFTAHGETAEMDYTIDEAGRLLAVNMPRWGNPEGGEFHYANCGGLVEEEAAFGGYTIPARLRVGWHYATDRFEKEGEFFRVTLDDAMYR